MASPGPRLVKACSRCGYPQVEAPLRLCSGCAKNLVRRLFAYESVALTGVGPAGSVLVVVVGKN